MEITVVSPNILKFKFKQTSFILANNENILTSLSKATEADAVLIGQRASTFDFPKVQNVRLTIDSPGEYEVGGVKINGFSVKDGTVYFIAGDGVTLFVGNSSIESFDKKKEVSAAVFYAETSVNEAMVTDFSPSYLVLHGAKAMDCAKEFGKESVTPISKIVIAREKLPTEMEVVVLQ